MYTPSFDLLLLELAAFQVAPHHPLIDFFTEFVKKISATVIFAMLYIHIYVVAVLYLHSEDFRVCANSSIPISPLLIQLQVSRAYKSSTK